jgi:hypothetical protein
MHAGLADPTDHDRIGHAHAAGEANPLAELDDARLTELIALRDQRRLELVAQSDASDAPTRRPHAPGDQDRKLALAGDEADGG